MASVMSVVFKPPAPPRKRSRLSSVSVSVSRSPTALFAPHNPPLQPAARPNSATAATAATATTTASTATAASTTSGAASSAPHPVLRISSLVVPSSDAWSRRLWWSGRRVLIPSFIFPQWRAAALHALLSALRCVILDEWSDGAVELCVVDEEDAVREWRIHSRTHPPTGHTAPSALQPALLPLPPPHTVSAPLTLSTTLSHLNKAALASVPVLSLSSLLASTAALLASARPAAPHSSSPTLTLSSLSGSHAPFSRSFVADGSGLPSHPLLWLTASKQSSPFIRPRRGRGRQQQPSSAAAADQHRQQLEEAAREKERERTGRHTCEVCGEQFSGLVDAHTADATHARKQREQNWQPLIELAQHLNRRRLQFDQRWSEQQRSNHSTATFNDTPDKLHEGNSGGVSSSDSLSSGSSSLSSSCDGGISRVRRGPSGLCVWYSSHPPPARCFANWYGDDVVWAAPQHLHRTLASDNTRHEPHTNYQRNTDAPFGHIAEADKQPPHCLQKRPKEAADEQSSAVRAARSRHVVPAQCGSVELGVVDVLHASGEWSRAALVEQQTSSEQIVSADSTVPHQTAKDALLDDIDASPLAAADIGRGRGSGVLNGAECGSKMERKRGKRRAASLGQPTEVRRKQRATQSTPSDKRAATWTAERGPSSGTQHSDGLTALEALSNNAYDNRLLANSHGDHLAERKEQHSASSIHSQAHDESSSASSADNGTAHTRRGSASLSTSPFRGAVGVEQQSHMSSRLERELVRLAQYDQQWTVVQQDDLKSRTRGRRSQAERARAAVDTLHSETQPAAEPAMASHSSSSLSRSDWLDAWPVRVTRSSVRQSGQSGDDLLKDAASLNSRPDGADLIQFMQYQCAQARKQRSEGRRTSVTDTQQYT